MDFHRFSLIVVDFRAPKPFESVSALPAALRRPQKKTRSGFVEHGYCQFIIFSSILGLFSLSLVDFRAPKPFVSVSALPAALRRPQKKTRSGFFEHVYCQFSWFSSIVVDVHRFYFFPGPQALCVCVGAACGASATSDKTRSGILKRVPCGLLPFLSIFVGFGVGHPI